MAPKAAGGARCEAGGGTSDAGGAAERGGRSRGCDAGGTSRSLASSRLPRRDSRLAASPIHFTGTVDRHGFRRQAQAVRAGLEADVDAERRAAARRVRGHAHRHDERERALVGLGLDLEVRIERAGGLGRADRAVAREGLTAAERDGRRHRAARPLRHRIDVPLLFGDAGDRDVERGAGTESFRRSAGRPGDGIPLRARHHARDAAGGGQRERDAKNRAAEDHLVTGGSRRGRAATRSAARRCAARAGCG